MHEIATVIKVDDDYATIRVQRSLACQGCNACGYSYANHMMTGRARNFAGAEAGDCVRVEVPTKNVLAVAATVYLVPIATMLAGYAIGSFLAESRVVPVGGGLAGLAGGMWIVKAVGERFSGGREFEPVVHAIIRRNPDREV